MISLIKRHRVFAAVVALFFAAACITVGIIIFISNRARAAEYVVAVDSVVDDPPITLKAEPERKLIPIPNPIPTEIKEPTAPISDEVPLSWELQQAVVDNCTEYDLEVALILGIMEAESDFNLESDNGICYGVMQIHKGNRKWVRENAGVEDIYDPAQNIRAGCWILSEGINLHGDIEKALVWYNAGEVYADSTYYSRNVLKKAEAWSAVIENTAA